MRRFPLIELVVAPLLLAAGCESDEPGDEPVDTDDPVVDTDEPIADPVPVTGIVLDAATFDPVADATVSVVDSNESTHTGGDGAYELDLVPGELVWLRASGPDFIATQRPLFVPEGGIDDFPLDVLPPGLADETYAFLALPDRDPTKGIVAVHFLDRSVDGGEAATIDAANDGSFTFDENLVPALSDALLAGVYDGLIFVNVELGDFTVTREAGACELENLPTPDATVLENELTRIDYLCD